MMRTAFFGWRDGLKAIRAMPTLVLITWGLLYLISITSSKFMEWPTIMPRGYMIFLLQHAWFANTLVRAVTGISFILFWLLLTPLLIAVHRYIFLNEITYRYAIEFSNPRFSRYFVLLFAVALVRQASLVLIVRPLLITLMTHVLFYLLVMVASDALTATVVAVTYASAEGRLAEATSLIKS